MLRLGEVAFKRLQGGAALGLAAGALGSNLLTLSGDEVNGPRELLELGGVGALACRLEVGGVFLVPRGKLVAGNLKALRKVVATGGFLGKRVERQHKVVVVGDVEALEHRCEGRGKLAHLALRLTRLAGGLLALPGKALCLLGVGDHGVEDLVGQGRCVLSNAHGGGPGVELRRALVVVALGILAGLLCHQHLLAIPLKRGNGLFEALAHKRGIVSS